MQPIGRERHAELPIAVEERIADFGITMYSPSAQSLIRRFTCTTARRSGASGELLSGQQTQQQNSGLWKALAEQREIGSDAIRREFR